MKNNKTNHQFKSWLFMDNVDFINKAAFISKTALCTIFLFSNPSVSANTVSKNLTISAYIIKNEQTNGLRIEADEYNFLSIYSTSLGRFQPLNIPFNVFSAQDYQLQTSQFYFRCQSESDPNWVDKHEILDIYFDKNQTPLSLVQTNKARRLTLPDKNYLKPVSGGNNVSQNPYPNQGWDGWYRHHQFDIVHGDFPQTNEEQMCRGMIGVMASSLI